MCKGIVYIGRAKASVRLGLPEWRLIRKVSVLGSIKIMESQRQIILSWTALPFNLWHYCLILETSCIKQPIEMVEVVMTTLYQYFLFQNASLINLEIILFNLGALNQNFRKKERRWNWIFEIKSFQHGYPGATLFRMKPKLNLVWEIIFIPNMSLTVHSIRLLLSILKLQILLKTVSRLLAPRLENFFKLRLLSDAFGRNYLLRWKVNYEITGK